MLSKAEAFYGDLLLAIRGENEAIAEIQERVKKKKKMKGAAGSFPQEGHFGAREARI